jgi:hypothetical protein
LQGWFYIGLDYRYSVSVRYDFRAGLTAGNDFRAGLTAIYVYSMILAYYDYMTGNTAFYCCKIGLSADHDFKTDLITFYDCRGGLSKGHNFRAGSYNKLSL